MFAGQRPVLDEEAIQAMFKLSAKWLCPQASPNVKLGWMLDHFPTQYFIIQGPQGPADGH
ncbi:hypothetical protein PtA15_2A650 [Puccinia triticina]|uniref:Uncharacterized protein n=1 Tax=Puccinia triticina TaxID=208348 RepID=A0ABY7CD89_9BASI|nr:uncharacterized protein PtA15_2A650 [Puccinia triticina]WAQ82333.1 hypothetical protein PtA15_2A650 [Puccinia triticina]WAR53183.1 hypothetical protein PtB15_2B614 [Puccinia triticina]